MINVAASATDMEKIIVEKNVDIKKGIVEKNIVEVPWTLRRASRLQAPPAPRPGTPRERITGKRREARPPPGPRPGRIPPCPRRRRSTWTARASDFIILFIIFFALGGTVPSPPRGGDSLRGRPGPRGLGA